MKTSADYVEILEKLYSTFSLGARHWPALNMLNGMIMLLKYWQ